MELPITCAVCKRLGMDSGPRELVTFFCGHVHDRQCANALFLRPQTIVDENGDEIVADITCGVCRSIITTEQMHRVIVDVTPNFAEALAEHREEDLEIVREELREAKEEITKLSDTNDDIQNSWRESEVKVALEIARQLLSLKIERVVSPKLRPFQQHQTFTSRANRQYWRSFFGQMIKSFSGYYKVHGEGMPILNNIPK